MDVAELTSYLDSYLALAEFDDYGPQGLQVEAENRKIERIALAVDCAPPVIEEAAAWDADMLLVHHGILWRSVERIAGPLGHRVRQLIKHKIHLYAAHLCLDAHHEVGNNAVLARITGVSVTGHWCQPTGNPIAVYGNCQPDTSLDSYVNRVEEALGVETRVLAHGPEEVGRIAILSGMGADKVGEAKELDVDTFLTGETSHPHFWAAADYGMNVIFAGHYATETVGVQALGGHLQDRFDLQVRFLDFPTQM